MLKWALIFLVLMLVAGLLGFVLKVFGFIFQLLFFVCLIGLVATVAMRWLGRRT